MRIGKYDGREGEVVEDWVDLFVGARERPVKDVTKAIVGRFFGLGMAREDGDARRSAVMILGSELNIYLQVGRSLCHNFIIYQNLFFQLISWER